MSYDICIAAAGTPVLAYRTDGDYQGKWLAHTARGFYVGSYGSCSGCDWQQAEHGHISYSDENRESLTAAIDAGIGREILKAEPMSLEQVIKEIEAGYYDDPAACIAWARKAVADMERERARRGEV